MSEKGVESPFVSFTELLTGTFLILIIIVVFLALNQGATDIEELEIRVGELNIEVGTLSDKRDELTVIIGELEQTANDSQNYAGKLRIAIQQLEEAQAQLKTANEELEADQRRISILIASKDTELAMLGGAEEVIEAKDKRIHELTIIIGNLEEIVATKSNDAQESSKIIVDLRGQIRQLRGQVRRLENRARSQERRQRRTAERESERIEEAIERRVQEQLARRLNFLRAIGTELRTSGLNVSVDSDALVFPDAVLFRHGSARLETLAQRRAVASIADILARNLSCNVHGRASSKCRAEQPRIAAVLIEGHADRSGDDAINWQLSAERAFSVLDNILKQSELGMARQEVDGRLLPQGLFAVAGFGETRNRVPTPDGQREDRNRRIEIRFIFGDLAR